MIARIRNIMEDQMKAHITITPTTIIPDIRMTTIVPAMTHGGITLGTIMKKRRNKITTIKEDNRQRLMIERIISPKTGTMTLIKNIVISAPCPTIILQTVVLMEK